jgi:hypothetical protein
MHLTREEREQKIREMAYRWYEIRLHNNIPGDEKSDWRRAEEIIMNDYPEHITLKEGGY